VSEGKELPNKHLRHKAYGFANCFSQGKKNFIFIEKRRVLAINPIDFSISKATKNFIQCLDYTYKD